MVLYSGKVAPLENLLWVFPEAPFYTHLEGTDGMVKIRLSRAGSKGRPFYHVVVTDSRSGRDGRFIERVGFYNPIAVANEEKKRIQHDRIEHWVARGAQISAAVKKLLSAKSVGNSDSPDSRAAH